MPLGKKRLRSCTPKPCWVRRRGRSGDGEIRERRSFINDEEAHSSRLWTPGRELGEDCGSTKNPLGGRSRAAHSTGATRRCGGCGAVATSANRSWVSNATAMTASPFLQLAVRSSIGRLAAARTAIAFSVPAPCRRLSPPCLRGRRRPSRHRGLAPPRTSARVRELRRRSTPARSGGSSWPTAQDWADASCDATPQATGYLSAPVHGGRRGQRTVQSVRRPKVPLTDDPIYAFDADPFLPESLGPRFTTYSLGAQKQARGPSSPQAPRPRSS